MSEYEVQALDFLKKAEAQLHISRSGEVKGFPFDQHDTLWHYKYLITITRKGKQYRFTFYDSHNNWLNNKRPSKYDVLASVEKYEPYDFKYFVSEFGYEIYDEADEKRVRKIYEACDKQYQRLLDLFGEDLMQELQEIN